MAEETPVDIGKKLDVLIALILCQLEHRTDVADIIGVLGRFDLQPLEIAGILGMTPNAVRIARHRSGRVKQKAAKKAKKS